MLLNCSREELASVYGEWIGDSAKDPQAATEVGRLIGERIEEFFHNLRRTIQMISAQGLFPYNPTALIRLLIHVGSRQS